MFHPKVTAAAIAGALTTMVVAELKRRQIDIDATEAASITTILLVLAGFFMPSDTPAGIVEVPVEPNAPQSEMQPLPRPPATPPPPPRVVPPPVAPLPAAEPPPV